jgi:hypothetical protein
VNDAVGSAAEEAAKLLGALQDWTRTRLDGQHLATGSSECQVCPVCQAIAAVRQVKPETVEHLLDAAASFVAALKSTVGHPDAEARATGVQHIKVRED